MGGRGRGIARAANSRDFGDAWGWDGANLRLGLGGAHVRHVNVPGVAATVSLLSCALNRRVVVLMFQTKLFIMWVVDFCMF